MCPRGPGPRVPGRRRGRRRRAGCRPSLDAVLGHQDRHAGHLVGVPSEGLATQAGDNYGAGVTDLEVVARGLAGAERSFEQLRCHPRLPLVACSDSERPAVHIWAAARGSCANSAPWASRRTPMGSGRSGHDDRGRLHRPNLAPASSRHQRGPGPVRRSRRTRQPPATAVGPTLPRAFQRVAVAQRDRRLDVAVGRRGDTRPGRNDVSRSCWPARPGPWPPDAAARRAGT